MLLTSDKGPNLPAAVQYLLYSYCTHLLYLIKRPGTSRQVRTSCLFTFIYFIWSGPGTEQQVRPVLLFTFILLYLIRDDQVQAAGTYLHHVSSPPAYPSALTCSARASSRSLPDS
jgi:hypothetical protein